MNSDKGGVWHPEGWTDILLLAAKFVSSVFYTEMADLIFSPRLFPYGTVICSLTQSFSSTGE
jgi:hypothetical protein